MQARIHHKTKTLHHTNAHNVSPSYAACTELDAPVAPKVLPHANSHMPAKSWTRPPTKMAIPITMLGVFTLCAFTLTRERMSVVDAKENRPLFLS